MSTPSYSFVATWVGGTVMTYNMVSFNPEDLIKTFAEHKVTFTSPYRLTTS